MKLYKEFVVLGVALIGATLLGVILILNAQDTHPTVDTVTPLPLKLDEPGLKTNERTEEKPSDGDADEIHS